MFETCWELFLSKSKKKNYADVPQLMALLQINNSVQYGELMELMHKRLSRLAKQQMGTFDVNAGSLTTCPGPLHQLTAGSLKTCPGP